MDQQLIDKAIEYLEKTGTFVSTQAPEIVSQALKYQTYSSIYGLLIGSFLLIICITALIYSYYYRKYDEYGYIEPLSILKIFLLSMASLPLIGCVVTNGDILLKIFIAPKLYLLEYFINLKK